ncbi:unnamed protein product [Adineta ricciae]|uniref:Uncharacterized protein n=1 Tax=Adineta ricciae TaxID=249248 RepID=A0A815P3L9_ADIRI|nr:unnamed protein product [Adineta ricciae]CAF1443685.1 unnamed protein product [Adineta ricciae]
MNSYNQFDRSKHFTEGTTWTGTNDSKLLLPYMKSDLNIEVMDYVLNQPIRAAVSLNCNLFESEIANLVADCYHYAIDIVIRDPTCPRAKLWDYSHLIQENKHGLILHEQLQKQVQISPHHSTVHIKSRYINM